MKSGLFTDDLVALGYKGEVYFDEPMTLHTTFAVGGTADIFAMPTCVNDIKLLLQLCAQYDIQYLVMGNGSNLLVRDGGIRGLIICMGSGMSGIEVDGEKIYAQAGAKLYAVARTAYKEGLSGLEFAYGIPGSVGGAVFMNAGAYSEDMAGITRSAKVLEKSGEIKEYTADMLDMSYRHSSIMQSGGIVLEAALVLHKAKTQADIKKKMDELQTRRREKQPLNYPSAGSFFKRPKDNFAGKLIEDAGLKGKCVGGSKVSERHAGFIINTGGATCKDILTLKDLIISEVESKFQVKLECEVQIVGTDD